MSESKKRKVDIYPEFVKTLCTPGVVIAAGLGSREAHNLHMAIGGSVKAAEILDMVKKLSVNKGSFDRKAFLAALGELEFYLEGLRGGLGIRQEECISYNMSENQERYKQLKK